jgi:ATP-dependent Clp protease ATP-binding subunit ClpC
MYERFTDSARRVMNLAGRVARCFHHEYIGTQHILLALFEEGSGATPSALKNLVVLWQRDDLIDLNSGSAAANVLKCLHIDLRKIRLEVEKIIQSGPDEPVLPDMLPLTPRAKKVIEYAIEEARNLNHNYVGTEHLLLGLLREREGVAAQVLMNLGLRFLDVRQTVLDLVGQPGAEQSGGEPGAICKEISGPQSQIAPVTSWFSDFPKSQD